MRHGSGRHGVVAVNTARLIRNDKSTTGSADLISHRPTLEPFIQHRFATGKIGAVMI